MLRVLPLCALLVAAGSEYCEPQTEYVTITSTKIDFDTRFNTRMQLVPTTVYQDLTETTYLPSVQTQTQLVTQWGNAAISTSTKVLYDTKYRTRQEYATETVFATRTSTVFYTDTSVVSRYVTSTQRVPNYVTSTVFRTQTVPEVRYITQTQVQYETRTETQQVPRYRTTTVTSGYPDYKQVTETEYQQQYVTVTRTQQQNQYVTVCNQQQGGGGGYPSYGKK